MEPEPPGAAYFCLEPEPTQIGRSRGQLRDLGHAEPEPPKTVAAPQHCLEDCIMYRYTKNLRRDSLTLKGNYRVSYGNLSYVGHDLKRDSPYEEIAE